MEIHASPISIGQILAAKVRNSWLSLSLFWPIGGRLHKIAHKPEYFFFCGVFMNLQCSHILLPHLPTNIYYTSNRMAQLHSQVHMCEPHDESSDRWNLFVGANHKFTSLICTNAINCDNEKSKCVCAPRKIWCRRRRRCGVANWSLFFHCDLYTIYFEHKLNHVKVFSFIRTAPKYYSIINNHTTSAGVGAGAAAAADRSVCTQNIHRECVYIT